MVDSRGILEKFLTYINSSKSIPFEQINILTNDKEISNAGINNRKTNIVYISHTPDSPLYDLKLPIIILKEVLKSIKSTSVLYLNLASLVGFFEYVLYLLLIVKCLYRSTIISSLIRGLATALKYDLNT
ncbi:MAG: hypothetical protein ABWK01_01795 [Infirmifilum sp.]